jgi:hypothetical protein
MRKPESKQRRKLKQMVKVDADVLAERKDRDSFTLLLAYYIFYTKYSSFLMRPNLDGAPRIERW